MRQPDSTQTRLRAVPSAADTSTMTRLALVGADADRAGRRAPAGSDNGETSGAASTLVSIRAARSFGSPRRRPSPCISPGTDGPNSSPAKSRRASRNALRSVGSFGNGEHAVVVAIRDDDGGPDDEAA
jgi:hypothetical protein